MAFFTNMFGSSDWGTSEECETLCEKFKEPPTLILIADNPSRLVTVAIKVAWRALIPHISNHLFRRTSRTQVICSFPFRRLLCEKTTASITNAEKKFQQPMFNATSETSSIDEKTTSMRNMKYTFLFMGLSLTIVGSYVILTYGKPEQNEETGDIIKDEFSSLPTWQQYILRGLKRVEEFAVFIQEPSRDKLLPDPLSYPYYQPPYTLVLEFTDVLAHPEWTYQTGWRFKKRPGVDHLLENLAGLYEIVVFTAEPGITIFPVIEALDQKGLISYKLVRDSTHFVDGHHIKNLERLNRDLKRVIVIDWNSDSVKFHRDNHFNIARWHGNDEDNTLIELTGFLKTIAQTDIEDVREVLKFYNQFEDPLAVFKQKQLEYLEQRNAQPEKPPIPQPQDSVRRLFNILL